MLAVEFATNLRSAYLVLLPHINSCQTSRVRGHTKGAGAVGSSEKPNEIKIRPGNTTLPRLKTHDTEEGAQVKRSNAQTELTWPRVSTQLQHRVPPFPQITNSRLQTTAVGLPVVRLGCLHRTNRTVIVSIDDRACCLECCQSDDPRACSETRAIEPTTTAVQISIIAPPSRVV